MISNIHFENERIYLMIWIVGDYVIYHERWFRVYSCGFRDYWYSAIIYNQVNISISGTGAVILLNIDIKVTKNVVSFFQDRQVIQAIKKSIKKIIYSRMIGMSVYCSNNKFFIWIGLDNSSHKHSELGITYWLGHNLQVKLSDT